ncbi:aminoglycoside 3'-phosphotransferase/choline kinase domain protein [Metarhizium robertsii]|uniref:Aminoglycoside 3'-phosphotransferase/choline kinase domain protein n=1 Tax=Metarhizium robertsii TaxID=568076 RepID=A0A014PLG6_9HYPO|nr:aminoglycoside 3'-phosphotransferase/choline kinase domain protein [Metarhizium robertsii]
MAAKRADELRIDIASLPDMAQAEMDFRDTSFFRSGDPSLQLPSPSSIIQQFGDQGACVVKLEHLNLAVKIGHSDYLRLEEVKTMRAIRQVFADTEVPVPEVFGWRKYGDDNFIYMSLMPGQTLREVWPTLTSDDKTLICVDLNRIVKELRRLGQGSSSRSIASINGGTVQDKFFKLDYEEGPFQTIKSFNDWLLAAATRQRPGPNGVTGPYREYLPDTGEIYFTHGDLTLGNIIISDGPGPRRIAGIIDWEQAGWYPEYWEYCKLLYGVEYQHEWRSDGWADKIMRPFETEWDVFAEYALWRCP